MSEIPQLPGQPIDAVRVRTPASPSTERGAPAFEALLERLEARAAELEERSRSVSGAAEIPGALDAARASLEEALHLGGELLEAYRAAERARESRP